MKLIKFLFIVAIMYSCSQKTRIEYPETRMDTAINTYFGTEVADPYRWLEDDRSAETMAWVEEQNKVTYSYLEQLPFREGLRNRLTELMDYPKYGSPSKIAGKYYFYKNDGLQNQSVLYELETLDAEPKVLLDPNKLSEDGTVALSNVSFSKDGKYLAYSISRSGSDWTEIYVMDVESRKLLSDKIEWVKFSGISWQGNGFYYSAYSAPEPGKEFSNKNEFHKVYYHRLGQAQSKDQIVFENKEFPLRNVGAGVSEDEQYLFLTETESTSGNSLWIKDLTKSTSKPLQIAPGFDADFSVVEHYNGKVYVLTNYKAPNQRLMAFDPSKPQLENWTTVIPESTRVLSSVSIIGGKLFVRYMRDAAHHLYAFNLDGDPLFEVELPTIGTVGISGKMDDNEAFYTFTSYTFPPTIYRYNVAENTAELFRASEVSFNPEDYISEQVFYTSKDGTNVPMSITYKKGLKKDGTNPTMLYGYGGFNISLLPSFSIARIPFLEQGGVYAIANLRGGGEYGESWHRAGTKMQKQNVFDDFISAAEYLINEKFTSSKKLAINGGSNGGLLVGAAMVQRPDLFAVAIPEVGVLDMLRYQKFTIGWAWATDYGTSEESKEMFEYLYTYSPLHNLKTGTRYPATMVTTGDHDDRVVPAHSFKFAATLQKANDGYNPTLIRIDVNAGHGAGKPTSKIIDAQTDVWSFVMHNLGMKPKF
jgi:prolyl oligopeptidase